MPCTTWSLTEAQIEDAMFALLSLDQVVAEGSGAVGVAALRAGRLAPGDGRPVAVVVTGGTSFAPRRSAENFSTSSLSES